MEQKRYRHKERKMKFFWNVTLCSLARVSQCFEGMYCLHLLRSCSSLFWSPWAFLGPHLPIHEGISVH